MTRSLSLLLLAITLSPAGAQFDDDGTAPINAKKSSDVGSVSASIEPRVVRRGEEVTLKITVTPKKGAWTYPASPQDPKQSSKNSFDLSPTDPLIFVSDVKDPTGWKSKPRAENPALKDDYYPAPTTWLLKAIVSPKATPGKAKAVLGAGTSLGLCTDSGCFYATAPTVEFDISAEPPLPVPEKYEAAVKAALDPPKKVTASPSLAEPPSEKIATQKLAVPPEKYIADLEVIRSLISADKTPAQGGLAGLLATAALWGFISLVTPCVFPMIPITVSIFLKQAHESTAQTLKLASVYCLTIIVVLGISAFALLKLFVDLSVSPGMNLFLGALFVFFALSLFGWYDLTLPQGMLKFTQRRQGSGGVVGTIFGALAFTIIGFTCVAPFLGGFAGLASSGNYSTVELILGALAFSTAFASPFFFLALFPRMLKALPRSGGWLDSVKAVMGFLEIAAALKFLRTAEIGWRTVPEYFTFDVVLSGWVAIFGACGLYLLNVFRLPHDEEKPNIGVPRLIFAIGFLWLAVYLTPALFKGFDGKPQRPGGVVYAWIDSFLLPETNRESASDLPFSTDLKAALEAARSEEARTGKPSLVFVDFTGVTCTNCKYNEHNIFINPAVKDLLKRFKLVQLYTDWVPEQAFVNPPPQQLRREEALANRAFKERVFDTEQLPYYVILDPLITGGVKVVGVYDEGKINEPSRFATFLRNALEKAANP